MSPVPLPLLRTAAELAVWRQHCSAGLLHFVPTMGALHRGHEQLIRRAGAPGADGSAPRVLVSVFVNPLQFGPAEDFHRYPRDLQSDRQLAAAAGAAALFVPDLAAIYPQGPEQITRVLPPRSLSDPLCGRHRPGHFEGVATVVVRLLALVRPDLLLLGEKDWQQLVILRRVIADLALPVRVLGCPTVREADGLACSSRNRYLDERQRRQALALPTGLRRAAERYRAGQRDRGDLLGELHAALEAAELSVEYLEAVLPHTLEPAPPADLAGWQGPLLLAAAVRCGSCRLIDHTVLLSRAPIVAIDGPAGAGKSTVTRALADRLGLLYLDTGAMYRAFTWLLLEQGVDPADGEAIASRLDGLELELEARPAGGLMVRIQGQDVTAAIRAPEVTAQVSAVAAHGSVRQALTRQQQALGRRGGLVAEGRDIGTAVFPDAELKVFLTATPAERARRRAQDLAERGFAVPPLAELESQIVARDLQDSTRAVAPLVQAADAIELITDGLTIEAVIESLVDLFRQRVPEEAWPGPPRPSARS